MATTFAIDGSAASIKPVNVSWQRQRIGTDHAAAPLVASKWEVVMSFDSASPPHAAEWLDLEDGASHTIDTLARNQLGWKTLSPVYIAVDQYPAQEDIHSGPFVIRITNATD